VPGVIGCNGGGRLSAMARWEKIGEDHVARYDGGYRGGSGEIPFPEIESFMAEQVGLHPFPHAHAHFGGVIQEPIPEIFIKFVIKHISSAV
jgi:hypothetical protein